MRFFTTTSAARNGRRAAAILATAGLAFSLAACTIDNNDNTTESTTTDSRPEDAKKSSEITVNVKDGDTAASVGDLLTVSSGEKLENVSLVNDAGLEVEGKKSEDGKKWVAGQKLGYGRSYTLTASTKDDKLNSTFTTEVPAGQTNASLSPLDGSTVGTGQSVSFQFDTPITDRQAVEDLISIETIPKVEGAFYWISNQALRWRPENYWEPGTKVSVKADLYGHDLGGGVYGEVDRSANFTIGDSMHGVVDDNKKTMTVYKNGEVIKTIPVSLGHDGGRWSTPNGIYQVGDQHERLTMDSNTFGFSEAQGGYVTDVNYATQLSYSGIYVHGAPWASWALGNTNQSHGCVNASEADAQWVLQNFKRGDTIEIKNTTGETLSGNDGLGDWNIDWKTWKAGNADAV